MPYLPGVNFCNVLRNVAEIVWLRCFSFRGFSRERCAGVVCFWKIVKKNMFAISFLPFEGFALICSTNRGFQLSKVPFNESVFEGFSFQSNLVEEKCQIFLIWLNNLFHYYR